MDSHATRGLWREQWEIPENLPAGAIHRHGCECRGFVAHVRFVKHAEPDACATALVGGGQQSGLVGNGEQDEIGMRLVGIEQVAGGSDARVDGLNGLVSERDVLADQNVEMLVGDGGGLRVANLQHDWAPVSDCRTGMNLPPGL
jgi:hypothetical protein